MGYKQSACFSSAVEGLWLVTFFSEAIEQFVSSKNKEQMESVDSARGLRALNPSFLYPTS